MSADVGGLVWLPFLVAFTLAMLTAASYTELVSAHPHAAGSAHYVALAFGRPWLTFLVGFVVAASAISTAAAVSRAVGGTYLEEFVTSVPVVPVAVGVVMLLAAVTWVGIAESARANAVMTAVEVTGLVLVVIAGVVGLLGGEAEPARLLEPGSTDPGAFGLLGAAALAFFAYLGFEDAVHLSEEVRHPARTFPRAMFVGLGIVGVLYLAVTSSASMLVDPTALAASGAPLLDALETGPVPVPGRLFAAIAIVAVTNTGLVAITTASRQLYGLAEEGQAPPGLARVGRRRTPTAAIVVVAVLVGALTATGGVRELADTTVALLLAVFATVNVTVLVVRRRVATGEVARPEGTFHTAGSLAVLGALVSAVLLGHTLIVGGVGLWMRLGVLVVVGVVLDALGRALRRPRSAG